MQQKTECNDHRIKTFSALLKRGIKCPWKGIPRLLMTFEGQGFLLVDG